MYKVICSSISRGKVFRKGSILPKAFFGKDLQSYIDRNEIELIEEKKVTKPKEKK